MKLAAVGDNCMDVYQSIGKAFPGGNPVNVSVYFVRMGGNASYTGVVGNDKYGDEIITALGNKGVDISSIRVLEGKTAVTQVELVNGERVFGDYDEGVLADFKLTDKDIDFISGHDMAISGIWGMVEDSIPIIKSKGTKIAFDFATKLDDPIVDQIISFIDYAFFSYECDDDYIRNYMKEKKGKGAGVVVVTLGENGSLAYDGSDFYKHGIVSCKVVDSMGAGDSYIAGFLKGILEKQIISECMSLGAENSSITLGYMGAW